MFSKVIIWGYPLHSHTHSYIHYGWVKGFRALGYDTYWFHNEDFPSDFDYKNALFITEGYADKNIPIESSSIYFVHICVSPERYLSRGARLIEIRFNVDSIIDYNYHYVLHREQCVKISDATYYQRLTDNGGLMKHHTNPKTMNYECIYTMWATDLLPSEIDTNNMYLPREPIVYYIGSGITAGWSKFMNECARNNIGFKHIDPWSTPISFEENQKLVQKSYIATDIRSSGDPNKIAQGENGTCHKQIGYIPCRVFKNISYGQVGSTNSRHVYNLFNHDIVYNDDEAQLFYDTVKERQNYSLIQKQMELVKSKHTYLNRIDDLLTVLKIGQNDYQQK